MMTVRIVVDMVVAVLLAAFHEVSVYPKKDLPFFILFTAGLCSFTALLAVLTHQYPEPMGTLARVVSTSLCFVSRTEWYMGLIVCESVSVGLVGYGTVHFLQLCTKLFLLL